MAVASAAGFFAGADPAEGTGSSATVHTHRRKPPLCLAVLHARRVAARHDAAKRLDGLALLIEEALGRAEGEADRHVVGIEGRRTAIDLRGRPMIGLGHERVALGFQLEGLGDVRRRRLDGAPEGGRGRLLAPEHERRREDRD